MVCPCCAPPCSGPCDEENPCPEGCICCNGECVEEIPEGECCGPCDEENPCPEGCYCCDGVCQSEPCEGVCCLPDETCSTDYETQEECEDCRKVCHEVIVLPIDGPPDACPAGFTFQDDYFCERFTFVDDCEDCGQPEEERPFEDCVNFDIDRPLTVDDVACYLGAQCPNLQPGSPLTEGPCGTWQPDVSCDPDPCNPLP
jgi:hypothetical protein